MERSIFFLLSVFVLSSGLAGSEKHGGAQGQEDKNATLVVQIRDFAFIPDHLEFNEGQQVKLLFDNQDSVVHGVYIEGYEIRTHLWPRQKTTLEFTAHMPGVFKFACCVWCGDAGPRKSHFDMVGTITVKPAYGVTYTVVKGPQPKPKIEIGESPPWFTSTVTKVKPGEEISWVCRAGWAQCQHEIFFVKGPDIEKPGAVRSGPYCGEWTHAFYKPGVYTFVCAIHPYMRGYVVVEGEGVQAPEEIKWPPPDTSALPPPGSPGRGEVMVDVQFAKTPDKPWPGYIVAIDTGTWQIRKTIWWKELNNPHNLWTNSQSDTIYQTEWHTRFLTAFDPADGHVIKRIWLGNPLISPVQALTAPAHVVSDPSGTKLYVTLNASNEVVVVDARTMMEVGRTTLPDGILGPHGNWVGKNGKFMVMAATLSGKLVVFDLEKNAVTGTFDLGPLPLFAATDDNFAWATSAIDGTLTVVSLKEMKEIKRIQVGALPIQAVPSPDGKYVLVSCSGSSEVYVIDAVNWEVKKVLRSGPGAHGVTYGPKAKGGLFAYVSNKFTRYVTVIDLDSLEVAGNIDLGPGAFGGNGILHRSYPGLWFAHSN